MRDVGPLLPFQELVHETEVAENESCKEDEECKNITLDDSALPDPCALLHVTNRRKVPPRKKSLPLVCTFFHYIFCSELLAICIFNLHNLAGQWFSRFASRIWRFAYKIWNSGSYILLFLFLNISANLFALYTNHYLIQRTLSEIQIECLTRKLAEADMFSGAMYNDYFTSYLDKGTINGDNNISLRESEAILVIKRLQEQVVLLLFCFILFCFIFSYGPVFWCSFLFYLFIYYLCKF